MVANADLAAMLDHTCTVYRPSETVSGMVTQEGLALSSTGLALHIQTIGRDDVARGYGYQDSGDHLAFFQSTANVQRGDLIRPDAGPWSGENFWVRGPFDDTDIVGIEHLALLVEFTDESLTLPSS